MKDDEYSQLANQLANAIVQRQRDDQAMVAKANGWFTLLRNFWWFFGGMALGLVCLTNYIVGLRMKLASHERRIITAAENQKAIYGRVWKLEVHEYKADWNLVGPQTPKTEQEVMDR